MDLLSLKITLDRLSDQGISNWMETLSMFLSFPVMGTLWSLIFPLNKLPLGKKGRRLPSSLNHLDWAVYSDWATWQCCSISLTDSFPLHSLSVETTVLNLSWSKIFSSQMPMKPLRVFLATQHFSIAWKGNTFFNSLPLRLLYSRCEFLQDPGLAL